MPESKKMEIRKFVAQTGQISKLNGSVEARERSNSKELFELLNKLKLLQENEVIAGIEIKLQKTTTHNATVPVFTINAYFYDSGNNQAYTEALHKNVSSILRKRTHELAAREIGLFLHKAFSECSILLTKDDIHGEPIRCTSEDLSSSSSE